MHRKMADMMKVMGSAKRGPMAASRMLGFGGGMKLPTPEQMKALRRKCPAAWWHARIGRYSRRPALGPAEIARPPAPVRLADAPGFGGIPGKKK